MPKIVMDEYEEYPVIAPDSIISVRVEEIAVKEVQGNRGPWLKAEFTFKILDTPAEYKKLVGEKIWGSVPFRFTESPDNKLRQWVEAILGMELSAGFELDTDLLIGRECRAVISNYEKKALNPRTGQPYKAHQIDALLTKGGQGVAAPAAPTPVAAVAAAPNPWLGSASTDDDDLPPF